MTSWTCSSRHVRSATLLVALAGACAAPEAASTTGSPLAPAPPHEPAPEVLYAGCEAVTSGPVCRLRAGATLRLWVGTHAEAALDVRQDDRPLAVTWTPAADGLRAEVPASAGLLTLAAADAAWRWSLQLAPTEPPPAALVEVDARTQAGAYAEALALLAGRLPELRGAALAEGLKARADLEFLLGDLSAALRSYDQAFAAALAEGLLGRAGEVALTATFVCATLRHDLAGARDWLARHESLIDRLPEARLRHDYYAGLVADRAGDVNAAIRRYRAHARVARALGQAHDVAAALSALGVLLGRLGDALAAEAAFAEALALGEQVPAGERALLLYNAAWTALEARARGEEAPDPEPRFAAAAALFGPEGPRPDRFIAADAQLNLAYAATLRRDADAAAAALARVEVADRRTGRWRLYVAARIDALAGRHAAALRGFTTLAARAREDDDRGLEWSAELGAGDALAAGGDDEAALERYRRAASLHRADVGALAIEHGRERFAAGRDGGAQGLVATLLRLGRAEEAACAARQARAHAFADLAATTRDPAALAAYRDARAGLDAALERTWELPRRRGEAERARLRAQRQALDAGLDAALRGDVQPEAGARAADKLSQETAPSPDSPHRRPTPAAADDLPRETAPSRPLSACPGLRDPAPGELLLVYYPLAERHVGFAVERHGVVAAALSDPDAALDRGAALLGPFDAALARARRVTIVASGRLGREAFHALPWRGAPLVAARPVAYGLDLSRTPGPPRPLARAVQLVPPSNLARAREEADAVRALLGERAVAVVRLRGDEPALAAALTGVDLLHFVGHARGGGWGSALDLGGERSLAARDLLAAPAPAIAVLSGCETGLHDPRSHAGGMSLAHALLLAGADAVIAADDRVDDDLAAELVPAATRAIADGHDPVAALRAAQQQLRDARSDWSRFRVFVP
ncbi:CHAT domain-containing protein [Nannocystis pusilla]|uniref:CHAT domain-containing protein n=1 Tax=Nannocystis pusilla TaxID=889268 RepID=A0ABS7TXB3_9BACT|nr:CHAT domain-containing protein [Nannocystis pusilla]MBZ5712897.1 CHAT domain-containing protein [Nannocystis pusilla]